MSQCQKLGSVYISFQSCSAQANRLCPQAGEWETECRHAWVSGRMQPDSGYKTEDLKVCGENPDCTFELIDFRPEKDILAQIDLCTNHVKPSKTVSGTPCSDGGIPNQMPKKSPEFSRTLPILIASHSAAASVQCSGIGTCEGDPYLVESAKNMQHFKKYLKTCPPQGAQNGEPVFTHWLTRKLDTGKGPNVRPPPKLTSLHKGSHQNLVKDTSILKTKLLTGFF